MHIYIYIYIHIGWVIRVIRVNKVIIYIVLIALVYVYLLHHQLGVLQRFAMRVLLFFGELSHLSSRFSLHTHAISLHICDHKVTREGCQKVVKRVRINY